MKTAIIVLTLWVIALGSLAVAYGDSTSVQLRPGWNLVTWTGETTDGLTAAYGWNPTTQVFDRYFPDRPDISTLTQLDEGQAYWILASKSLVLTTVDSSPTPCPECPACPEPTPCPQATACPECAVSYDWECTEVRQHAMEYESYLKFCESNSMGFDCTYEAEELAAAEAYLDAYCR